MYRLYRGCCRCALRGQGKEHRVDGDGGRQLDNCNWFMETRLNESRFEQSSRNAGVGCNFVAPSRKSPTSAQECASFNCTESRNSCNTFVPRCRVARNDPPSESRNIRDSRVQLKLVAGRSTSCAGCDDGAVCTGSSIEGWQDRGGKKFQRFNEFDGTMAIHGLEGGETRVFTIVSVGPSFLSPSIPPASTLRPWLR